MKQMNADVSVENLFLILSLYNPIKFTEEDVESIGEFFFNTNLIQFDSFCVECKKESTFKLDKRVLGRKVEFNPFYGQEHLKNELNGFATPFQITFSCQRNNIHKYSFSFRITDFEITKVGQFPSAASIESHTIQKYKKILSEDYRDFSKAIGLFSHSIGAGSFVYLRRIFENLIEDKHLEASQELNWNEEAFLRSKMDEKIKLLTKFLPSILVENRKVYSILSKGIHDLTEKECLSLFPKIKLAIELILDEKIYLLEQQQKTKSVSSFVSTTVERLKS